MVMVMMRRGYQSHVIQHQISIVTCNSASTQPDCIVSREPSEANANVHNEYSPLYDNQHLSQHAGGDDAIGGGIEEGTSTVTLLKSAKTGLEMLEKLKERSHKRIHDLLSEYESVQRELTTTACTTRWSSMVEQVCSTFGTNPTWAVPGLEHELRQQPAPNATSIHDIWYLTRHQMDTMLADGYHLTRPIVLVNALDYHTNDLHEFQKSLSRMTHLDIQDVWSDAYSVPSVFRGRAEVEAVVRYIKDHVHTNNKIQNVADASLRDLILYEKVTEGKNTKQQDYQNIPPSRDQQEIKTNNHTYLPLNMLSLKRRLVANQAMPSLVGNKRFRLMDDILDKLQSGSIMQHVSGKKSRAQLAGKTGHEVVYEHNDLSSSLEFALFGMRGTFSGPHVDAVGGTYAGVLEGEKGWPLIIDATEEEKASFQEKGDLWIPAPGRLKMVVLTAGDVLLMPPGVICIHAPLTIQSCLMVGGMIWDNNRVLDLMRGVEMLANHPQMSNEAFPRQFIPFLDALEEHIEDFQGDFTGDQDHSRNLGQTVPVSDFTHEFKSIKEAIRRRISCAHKKNKGCSSDCVCRAVGMNGNRCHDWCGR